MPVPVPSGSSVGCCTWCGAAMPAAAAAGMGRVAGWLWGGVWGRWWRPLLL